MNELTEAELEELLEDLARLQDELTLALDGGKDNVQPVSLDQPIGRVSRVDALQQQAMAKESRRRAELRRAQVNAALTAAKSGDYGLCRACDEPVGYGRLKSRPEAPLCLDCQRSRERR